VAETSTMEFDMLQRRAAELGFHVQRHRSWDPTYGTGDLYIMEKRRFRGEHCDSILRYATAEQIHAYLNGVGS
jgi:hypothetical protein